MWNEQLEQDSIMQGRFSRSNRGNNLGNKQGQAFGVGSTQVMPPQYSPPVEKPSARIEGFQSKSNSIGAAVAIDFWHPNAPNCHMAGGVTYNKGSLKVPLDGLYFIYCQIWFNPSPTVGRFYVKKNGGEVILVSQSVLGRKTEGPVLTNGTFKLQAGDIIHVELCNPHDVWNGSGHTFLGLHMI